MRQFASYLFNLVTALLGLERKTRLREELSSDLGLIDQENQRVSTINSYTVRASLDLLRVQHLRPVILTWIMIGIFLATVRTQSFAILGLFVYLVIFARPARETSIRGIAYEAFFQVAVFVCLAGIVLGAGLGLSLNHASGRPYLSALATAQLVALIVYLAAIVISRDIAILHRHLTARLLHMLLIHALVLELVFNPAGIPQTQILVVGTLGWIAILLLGVDKRKVPAAFTSVLHAVEEDAQNPLSERLAAASHISHGSGNIWPNE